MTTDDTLPGREPFPSSQRKGGCAERSEGADGVVRSAETFRRTSIEASPYRARASRHPSQGSRTISPLFSFGRLPYCYGAGQQGSSGYSSARRGNTRLRLGRAKPFVYLSDLFGRAGELALASPHPLVRAVILMPLICTS